MKTFIVVLASYVSVGASVIGALQTGSQPVSWTLYSNLKKTWNEAAKFCRDQGGHLPVPDTHLSQSTLKDWVDKWQGNELRDDIWSGLYKIPKTEFNSYEWERDGQPYDFCTTPIHFWDKTIPEPNNLEFQLCVRLSRSETLWKTVACNDLNYVVCEIFEDCCAYSRDPGVTLTNAATTPYPEVTSLEDCWQLCDLYGEGCVMAKWNRDSATCAEQTPVKMNTASSSGEQTKRFLQHCFGGNVITSSFNVQTDSAFYPRATGSPAAASQNFVCTLAFTESPLSASNIMPYTANVVNAKPDIAYHNDASRCVPVTTLASTRDPDTTLATSEPKTTSTTTEPKTTPIATESKTTTATTEPQTTSTTTEPITTTAATEPKTTPTTTESKITPTTIESKTTPTTSDPITTPSTTEPKTTPSSIEPKTTSNTNEPTTTPTSTEPITTQADTFLSETALPKTNLLEVPMSDDTTSTFTGSSAERLTSTPRTHISSTSVFTSKTDGAETKCDYCHLCPCPLKCTGTATVKLDSTPPAEATQTPSPLDLFVVQKTATSKHRRHRSSEWAEPSVSTIVISVTIITTTATFVLFFICCDVDTLARCFGGKKSAAVKPDSKAGE